MQFGGSYLVSAPRATVWKALNDTAVLQAVIPGCKRIEWTSQTTLELEIEVGLGLMSPTFTGDLELRNVVPAESYTLAGTRPRGPARQGRSRRRYRADRCGPTIPTSSSPPWRRRWRHHEAGQGADRQLSARKLIDGFFARFGDAMGAEVMPLTK